MLRTCGVSVEDAAANLVGLLVAHEVRPGLVGWDAALRRDAPPTERQRALLARLHLDLRQLHVKMVK